MLAHNVFFALLDRSVASRQRLIDACRRYLAAYGPASCACTHGRIRARAASRCASVQYGSNRGA